MTSSRSIIFQLHFHTISQGDTWAKQHNSSHKIDQRGRNYCDPECSVFIFQRTLVSSIIDGCNTCYEWAVGFNILWLLLALTRNLMWCHFLFCIDKFIARLYASSRETIFANRFYIEAPAVVTWLRTLKLSLLLTSVNDSFKWTSISKLYCLLPPPFSLFLFGRHKSQQSQKPIKLFHGNRERTFFFDYCDVYGYL